MERRRAVVLPVQQVDRPASSVAFLRRGLGAVDRCRLHQRPHHRRGLETAAQADPAVNRTRRPLPVLRTEMVTALGHTQLRPRTERRIRARTVSESERTRRMQANRQHRHRVLPHWAESRWQDRASRVNGLPADLHQALHRRDRSNADRLVCPAGAETPR